MLKEQNEKRIANLVRKHEPNTKPRFTILMAVGCCGERRKESDVIDDYFDTIVEMVKANPTAETAIIAGVASHDGWFFEDKLDVWCLFVRHTKRQVGVKALRKALNEYFD